MEQVLGLTEPNDIILTVHAEVLLRIRQLDPDANYLIHPKTLVKNSIKKIIKSEKKSEIKTVLSTLLAEI